MSCNGLHTVPESRMVHKRNSLTIFVEDGLSSPDLLPYWEGKGQEYSSCLCGICVIWELGNVALHKWAFLFSSLAKVHIGFTLVWAHTHTQTHTQTHTRTATHKTHTLKHKHTHRHTHTHTHMQWKVRCAAALGPVAGGSQPRGQPSPPINLV